MMSFFKKLFNTKRTYPERFIAFSTILISSTLISCSYSYNNTLSPEELDKPIVVTTFTVLADMAENVAGNRLTIKSITKLGDEIHGYQPTPRDIVLASKADLIIENGLGLEIWAKKFISAAGDVPTVVLTDGMEPLLIESDAYAGKPNPHAWMSPIRAIAYVDNILDAFIELDPDGEDVYRQNASLYKTELTKLHIELESSLSSIPSEKRVLVTCEGAFSYLARDYGMDEAYLWPVNAESQVTTKRMLDLIQKIRATEIHTIFCESTVSSQAQDEVAKASGATFGGTFYVDSLSDKNGPASTLLELQRHNVQLILEGLLPNK